MEAAGLIPARSIACFEAWTARSAGEMSFRLPPKVPKGVRTAERKTTPRSEETGIAIKLACERQQQPNTASCWLFSADGFRLLRSTEYYRRPADRCLLIAAGVLA